MLVTVRKAVLISGSVLALMAGGMGTAQAAPVDAHSSRPDLPLRVPDCRGKPDGDYAYHGKENRTFYYTCTNQLPVPDRMCPPGTEFKQGEQPGDGTCEKP
jgi:hypothetical protein